MNEKGNKWYQESSGEKKSGINIKIEGIKHTTAMTAGQQQTMSK